MKKVLQMFGKFSCVVRFDTVSGSAEALGSENGPAAATDKGVAYREADGTWMAVYENQDSVYFQCGNRKWPLSDAGVRVVYWKSFLGSFFAIRRGTKILFRKLIGPRPLVQKPFDPTQDMLDEIHSDFYAFVASAVRRPGAADSPNKRSSKAGSE